MVKDKLYKTTKKIQNQFFLKIKPRSLKAAVKTYIIEIIIIDFVMKSDILFNYGNVKCFFYVNTITILCISYAISKILSERKLSLLQKI